MSNEAVENAKLRRPVPVLCFIDMAAKETTLNELGETLAYVLEHMATKEDLAALRGELKSGIAAVRTELKSDIATVRTELKSGIAALSEQFASIERELKQI